jgi:hypothetical protein
MPITTYILQKYNHLRYAMGPQCFLAFLCIFLTNLVAIALLWTPTVSSFMAFVLRVNNYNTTTDHNSGGNSSSSSRLPLILLALALASATAQLLWVVEKRIVPRVMLCTATAMLILSLVLIGVLVPGPTMARRFFQSTTLPLLLMFMETSRLPKATDANHTNNNKPESIL